MPNHERCLQRFRFATGNTDLHTDIRPDPMLYTSLKRMEGDCPLAHLVELFAHADKRFMVLVHFIPVVQCV